MPGQIIKILSNDYFVAKENKVIICKSRGNFRIKNITPQVGDYVVFDDEKKLILDVLERFNSLDRPNVSNINQAFIITSLKQPDFSTNLLDKLLCICYLNNIKPIICLTKKDLLKNEEYKKLKPIIDYYKKFYPVVYNTNLFKIKKMFKNKTTVFTGQTGAGKSSLINKLDKTLNFETDEISKSLGRGKHTTRVVTLVEMYDGKVLDTPGFSQIDLSSYSDSQLKNCFIEFSNFKCPYQDCLHINEENCSIKNNSNILKSRYDNYKKIIEKR